MSANHGTSDQPRWLAEAGNIHLLLLDGTQYLVLSSGHIADLFSKRIIHRKISMIHSYVEPLRNAWIKSGS